MLLNDLQDRFAIVAREKFSKTFPPETSLSLLDADAVQVDVAMTSNGVLLCSDDAYMEMLHYEEAKKTNVLPVFNLMYWAREAGKGLLLNPRNTSAELISRITGDARAFGVLDRVAVVSHSLKHTKTIRGVSEEVGIVGVLRKPEHYADFFKLGGNVATLRRLETTPMNVRLAEAAEGRNRHPFWVLANEASVQDVFNACGGLIGAKGMVMTNATVGREALRRRSAATPACGSFCVD